MKRALWIGLIAIGLLLLAAVGFVARLISRPADTTAARSSARKRGADTRTRTHQAPASRARAAGASLR